MHIEHMYSAFQHPCVPLARVSLTGLSGPSLSDVHEPPEVLSG